MSTTSPASRRWRRRIGLPVAMLLLAAVAVINASPSSATHQDVFELDGNIADTGGAAAPWDWTKFFSAAGARITPLPADFTDSGFDSDHAFPDASTFTSGSKDTLNIGTGWSCSESNNLGGKFDILNAYSTIYKVPTATADYGAGDLLLFFGIERSATEGDGNMGFWFLKDGTVDCAQTEKGKAPAFTGNHVDGDIFVVAGFSNGGTNAVVQAYLWNGGAGGSLSSTPFISNGALCTAGAPHNACGIVNTVEITPPWPAPDKNGGALDVNAFYEGFIRVPAAQVSGCFATFVANTRSSTSPTATIMDFSRGSFPTCQPSTSLSASPAPNATTGDATKIVVVGDSVTYSFTETNDGNTAITGAKVTTDNAACNTAMTPSGTVTLASGGGSQVFSCSVATDATTPGVTTIVGTGEGTASGLNKNVTWCATPTSPPANTICDQDERATAKAASIKPGTLLGVTPSPTTAKAGDTITYTITEQNDGTSPGTAYDQYLALDDVTITPFAGSGATATQVSACSGSLSAPTKTGGDQDAQLEKGETWTYTCTVTAPSASFTMGFVGAGTVLKGTANARTVSMTQTGTCTNSATLFCDTDERASASVTLIAPGTTLTVTGSAVVTYTFVEQNTGNSPLTLPTAGSKTSLITLEAGSQLCNDTALAYVSGDAGTLNVLDPGESWTFSCKGTLAGPTGDTGSTSSTMVGVGHGCDSTGDDVTAATTGTCADGVLSTPNERDRVTVTIQNLARGPNTP